MLGNAGGRGRGLLARVWSRMHAPTHSILGCHPLRARGIVGQSQGDAQELLCFVSPVVIIHYGVRYVNFIEISVPQYVVKLSGILDLQRANQIILSTQTIQVQQVLSFSSTRPKYFLL